MKAGYLVALTAHARRVPGEPREAFAVAAEAAVSARGGVLVRTCHRVEAYLPPEERAEGRPLLPPLPSLPAGGEVLRDTAAVRHVLAVATGADSVVVGEDQVLAQLRAALAERHGGADLDPLVERVFQEALAAGRRARAWRQAPPRSLADVALDRIEERAGPLAGRLVAVVGAGMIGRLAALAARRRGARVTVASRTATHAAQLAERVGGRPLPFEGPLEADTVGAVVAISGEWRTGAFPPKLRLLVDLSVPPSLSAAERALLGERHLSADELALVPPPPADDRLRRRLDELIESGAASFERWVRARSAVPAIRALVETAEARRARDVEALLRRLPDLQPREQALIERMSRRLVAGILHEPLSRLRDDADGERARAAHTLFRL